MKGRLRYLYRDRDRHGNVRFYVCAPGRKKVRIREDYGTPAFLRAYTEALDGEGEVSAPKAGPGTLAWLIRKYRASAKYRQLSERTRYVRGRLLDRICERDGDKPYARLESRHVRERHDDLSDKPEAANNYLKTLRQVYAWACEKNVGHATTNPANDVAYFKTGSTGFHEWTTDEVLQFMERHPIGTKAHLALALLLYLGVRRSDLVRLGPQMERDGWLHFTVQKTRTETAKPILPPLRAVLDASQSGHLAYLVTEFGKPFTVNGFGNWFRKRCDEAGLKQCAAHGLRKAGATLLAENGASAHELMAAFDWTSLKQPEGYTRKANKRRLTQSGMAKLILISPTSDLGGRKRKKDV